MKTRHDHIASLLMGVALADDHLDGRELDTVKRLLTEAMRMKRLPLRMEEALTSFDKADLDVPAAVAALRLRTDDEKRKLLELVAKVHDSDDTWDLAEDDYLREVGDALGLAPESYADLTIGELSIEDLGEDLMPTPPPLPKS